MTLNEWQYECTKTIVRADLVIQPWYCALGMAGEAGEAAEKVKKLYRDDNGILTPERQLAIAKELSDVLWYVAMTARACNLALEQVACIGLNKYSSRALAGTLHGEGDNR